MENFREKFRSSKSKLPKIQGRPLILFCGDYFSISSLSVRTIEIITKIHAIDQNCSTNRLLCELEISHRHAIKKTRRARIETIVLAEIEMKERNLENVNSAPQGSWLKVHSRAVIRNQDRECIGIAKCLIN